MCADRQPSLISKDTRVALTTIARRLRRLIVMPLHLRKPKTTLSRQRRHIMLLMTTCAIHYLACSLSLSQSYRISSQHRYKSRTLSWPTTTRCSTTTAQKRSFPLRHLPWTKSYVFGMTISNKPSAKSSQSQSLLTERLSGLP